MTVPSLLPKYPRRRHGPQGRLDLSDAWHGQSYYGQPALKNPQWDWKVSGYIAVAGAAGAAQALSFLGSLRDREVFRGARRNANLIGLAGAAAGSALLIADLKTPKRFYNMLRILRPTSPMSLGTYILGAFGVTTAVSALGDLAPMRRRPALRRVADVAQAGAALSGAGAATYTAALMSATSNPYWAAAPRGLGAQFATSAVAAGAAALALGERAGGRSGSARRLEDVAACAAASHVVASLAASAGRRASGVGPGPGEGGQPSGSTKAVVMGALPLAAYAMGRASRSPPLAVSASLALIAGSFLLRHHMLEQGKRAARRPATGFRFAQPHNLPRRRRLDRSG
ncbi:NrfD/PsrC family molybdoenzyme membrane anchor subunit [Roseitranquillus sediminis]|uniref:NrfD/PsrC family molybdoenzyme membrane anchor subunit n=1 Tax=Roseitranquillus sediminis TaxID=2809051 RepID=UPI001D0C857C|nr:NrfD/PsrC family molybdoenzyme membrane anchor subunit [Roseitranquillus sediminis]MBM9593386.1 polysulfide reductase NrfD [Roseitranquillus sediminis]